jgi:hypothetical protein
MRLGILRIVPSLTVVAFAAILFAPELFGGRVAVTANMARWRPWSESAAPEERAAPSHNPDSATSYYPRRAVLHAAWREETIPLWNPYTFCGAPFLADVQAGVLYPPNWFLLPFGPKAQMGYFLFLHVAWGGLGVRSLLRRFGASSSVAALCGVAFVANGYFAKHFGQPPFLATASWIPWVIALGLDVLRRPGLGRAALLGLAGGFLLLAGQPQIALHGAYAAGIVLAGVCLADPAARARTVPRIGTLGVAGALAALLAAAQLIPTIELASRSARAALPYATVISGSFHPVDAVRFLVPEFFGTPLTLDEWGHGFSRGDGFYLRHSINSIFAGTPIFLLAMWGMFSPRTRRAALPFTLLFAVSVLVAFGSPLARLAYEVLPGFRFSRIDRVGFLVILAQAGLAGLAAGDLARRGGRGRRIYGASIGLAAVGGMLVVSSLGDSLPERLGADPGRLPPGGLPPESVAHVLERTRTAALFAGGTAIALLLPASRVVSWIPLALAAVQLFLFAAPYRGDRPPGAVFADSPAIERLADLLDEDRAHGGGRFIRFGRDLPVRPYPLSSALPPSTNVPYRLRDVQGYNALTDRRLGEMLEIALGEDVFSHGIWSGRRIVAPTRAESMEHPLLDALAVRAAVGGVPFTAEGWRPVSSSGFGIWRNLEALPRVRLVDRGRGISPEKMKEILATGAFDPAREAIWVGYGEVRGRSDDKAEAFAGSVEVLSDTWNDLVIRTNAPGERTLVIADSFSRGWSARVDREPAEILPVYGLIRGVVLPPGPHDVELRYRPSSFRRGVALSLLGLLLTGAALAIPGRDRGRKKDAEPGTLSGPGRSP